MSFFFRNLRSRDKPADPFPQTWLAYLHQNVFLYRLLSEADQGKLRAALRLVIAEKFWEGCAGLQVTDEMRVTVAGQACLLVLGFEDYYFDELKTILLYPGGYLGRDEDPLGKADRFSFRLGEAHRRGPVVLSWWQACWDGRRLGRTNLVLHEFAHKLAELGDPAVGMPNIEDPVLAERWEDVTRAEYERLVEDADCERPTLLHPYGASNRAEFFAVLTESFFLKPGALRRQHPALYELLADWYRQDPAGRLVDEAVPSQAQDAEQQYARHVIAECGSAIRRYPDHVDAYRQRARWYCELGEFASALADCDALIRLAPADEQAAAYYERGSVYQSAGSYDRALADFDEAIRRLPDFAEAHRGRGSAHAGKGEREQALADFGRALRLNPKDHRAHIKRALVYYETGGYDKALRDLARAARLGADAATVYSHRARVRIGMADYERAIADSDEALRLDPTLAAAYEHRGVARYRMGAYDEAITALGEAIRIDPNHAEAYRARADAYQARGQDEKARCDREQAARLADEK
ncbi:MAG TPA: zinc-dependent peptidase [Gemmataceae bacterium]|jgi:hypothetical protein|nr:zinc-dependent peptidase [Gemmataceae bacterium]